MSESPLLLPAPRRLDLSTGHCRLPDKPVIQLLDADLYKLGELAREMLLAQGLNPELSANPAHTDVQLRLWLNPALVKPESYQLRISASQIAIEACDQAGVFYGLMTLRQLLRQYGNELPQLFIQDAPDFAARGVMLDISRDKVPTLDTLLQLVDQLAGWKINQLQLYTEHTFAYAGHEVVWADASPMTADDILRLDAYCAERFIELVPNQNSFGHLTRWLKHDDYIHLSETGPQGFMHPLTEKHVAEPYSLCPGDPGSVPLLRELYGQLLPHFRSRMFNVGADETFDLGQGRSREACEARGKGTVYLEFLKQIHDLVAEKSHLMQFWGDIVLNHPELIPQLPKPCIALNWGYEADHPFESEGAHFVAAGVPYYVCPGTSSWNTLGGRSDNMQANLLNAARAGLKHGAAGFLITEWGDNGHWQTLPVALPGFAYGAALAWACEANEALPLADVLDQHVFDDPEGITSEAWLELGTVYRLTGREIRNQTSFFALLHWHDEAPAQGRTQGLHAEGLRASLAVLDTLVARSHSFASRRPDADLMGDEFRLAAGLMSHACKLSLARMQAGLDIEALAPDQREQLATELAALLQEYRRIWLARNRPGGLDDSLKVLNTLLARYGEIPA